MLEGVWRVGSTGVQPLLREGREGSAGVGSARGGEDRKRKKPLLTAPLDILQLPWPLLSRVPKISYPPESLCHIHWIEFWIYFVSFGGWKWSLSTQPTSPDLTLALTTSFVQVFHWCLGMESMLLCFAPSSLPNPEREHRRRMFLRKSVYIVLSLSFSVKAPHHMFNIWVEFPSRTRACREREEKITALCVPLGGQHWVLSATLLTPGKHWWDQSYAVIWCCTGGFHSSQNS